MRQYPHVGYIAYVLPNGEGAGSANYPGSQGPTIDRMYETKTFSYAADEKGNRTKLITSYDFIATKEPWFIAVTTARKPTWSPIYVWDTATGYIGSSASYPVYDENNQLVTIISNDILLSNISDYLPIGFEVAEAINGQESY